MSKSYRLLVSFPPDQKEHLVNLASRLKLKRAELVRRLVSGQPLPNPTDFVAYQAVQDVLKVNADLARLGNLLKLALDDQNWRSPDGRDVEALIGDIVVRQREVKAAAKAIMDSVRS